MGNIFKISEWIRKNRIEILTVSLILIFASFLRFYRLDAYMNFLGDEGRDALMVQRILIDHDFPLLGPPTSVGNIYLGPIYYYMMAVSMAIFWLNPVAATGMVAIIGVATVALIYYLARAWFGKIPAALSAALYAISPVVIASSRSSWNPSPAPFFTLLAFLGFYQARKGRNFRWLILTGGALAAALQMHYLTLILLPVFIILWLYELFLNINKGRLQKYFFSGTLLAVLLFLFLMLPLVIFDFRYNFLNYRAIIALFGARDVVVSADISQSLDSALFVYKDQLIGRYMTAENIWLTSAVAVLVILPFFAILKRKIFDKWLYLALGIWLIIGILGLSFYRGEIYDHYLCFLNPAPYFLLGGLIKNLNHKWQIVAAVVLLAVLGFLNLQKNPLLLPPNNQLARTQEVAQFIIRESGSKPFNFALIADRNYDSAYQFYLGLYGHKPKIVPLEVTGQMFVVCEDIFCDPVHNPKYEIVAFGWSKVDKVFNVAGVRVYRLVPNPSGNPS